AVDSSGNHNTLTLSDPDISWSSDAAVGSHSLCLSKRNFAQINWPVVNTSNSFTVCTWVKLNNVEKNTTEGSRNVTFVSIDGKDVSSFFLQLNYHEGARFVFNRLTSDSPMAATIVAVGKERAKPGVWYHLAGVYNATDESLSLYVNGELQMSVPFTTPWQGTGCTAIGRGLYKGQNVDLVDGFIDETRLYAAALDRAKIKVLASKHNENVAGQ
ncbi:MAG TPA: LamG domain-containing protein, partial [Verrucomicrobiae bacterium]